MASNNLNGTAPLHPSFTTKLTSELDKPSTTFRFLDLPAELRNYIYKLLLPPTAIVLDRLWRTGTNKPSTIPHIAQVNRQIQSEYLPLLCRLTPLLILTTDREITCATLQNVGAMCAYNIRCLSVCVHDACFKVRLLDNTCRGEISSTVVVDCYYDFSRLVLVNKLEERKKRIRKHLEDFLGEHDGWKLGVEDWLDVIRLCDGRVPLQNTMR
ncbi:hypothetical protein LTR66_005392 [Elasticomyces elasticus]|nr:hypothetical protein LTR66_005392 [Elasticomyces elasticus]